MSVLPGRQLTAKIGWKPTGRPVGLCHQPNCSSIGFLKGMASELGNKLLFHITLTSLDSTQKSATCTAVRMCFKTASWPLLLIDNVVVTDRD